MNLKYLARFGGSDTWHPSNIRKFFHALYTWKFVTDVAMVNFRNVFPVWLPMQLHFIKFICENEIIVTLGACSGSTPWIHQCKLYVCMYVHTLYTGQCYLTCMCKFLNSEYRDLVFFLFFLNMSEHLGLCGSMATILIGLWHVAGSSLGLVRDETKAVWLIQMGAGPVYTPSS